MSPEALPKHIQRLIPKEIEKGIYYRLYPGKNGSMTLKWWVKVWKNGLPITQSSKSDRYSDALELKRKLIADVEDGNRRGGRVEQVRIKEVLEDYVSEAKVSDLTRKEYRYSMNAHLVPSLGSMKASSLDTDRLKLYRVQRVAGIVAKKRAQSKATVEELRKAANTTVNRDFALLRAAMKHASRRTPPKVLRVPYFPMEREDNARQGFLEEQHYIRLRDAFTDPGVQLLFVVDYGIGCRSGELRRVEWSMVDLEDGLIRLPGRITKNGKPRTVPIFAGDMMVFLKAAKAHRDEYFPESPWVFSRAGEPIISYRDQWDSACERAGCAGLLFHDLRRTAVRNMTRIHGIDRATAKKISGHLTDSMFSRYDIIDEEDIKAAKRKVDGNRTSAHNDRTIDKSAPLPPELVQTLGTLAPDRLAALISLLQS